MVYTPMGVSPNINDMVYILFIGSPKLKVYPFTIVIYWIFKIITQSIKNKLDNITD